MANIRTLDMKLVDALFDMENGYVLDFSDRTIVSFFAEELDVDINDAAYRELSASKAKPVRCFLNKTDFATSVRALQALWDYREATRRDRGRDEWVPDAKDQFLSLLGRIHGMAYQLGKHGPTPKPPFDQAKIHRLRQKLIELSDLEPQPRGYAFEAWLIAAFNAFGMEAREPFCLRGEQIEGSFQLLGETYLVEASGTPRQLARRICTPFTARSSKRRLGVGGCSLAILASPPTG